MTEVTAEPYIAPSLMGRCRLIKIKGHTKVAVEAGWQTKANYAPEDPDIISHISGGQNYGIMPTDGVIVIDCDTEEIYENLPAPWKNSLTVITGRDGAVGRHVFLDCPNSPHSKIVISKPVTLEPLGDIRGSDSPFYTVGAGSIHPDTGRMYKYVDQNAPLVAVDWSEVVTELIEKYGIKLAREMPVTPKQTTIASGGSLTDKLGLRIEDFAMPGNPVQRGNGDIQGSHPVHGSTTGMNFAINTSKNVWHCYRCNLGGDPVAWIAYSRCSAPETDCNHLTPDQFRDVKEWLKVNGYAAQLKKLDEDHFEAANSKLPKVDLSGILKTKTKTTPTPIDSAEIEQAIAAARSRNLLPAFPEIDPGLFKDYVDLGKRVSYSLHEFHFAALLAVVSMALGRKVRIQVGMTDVYTNVFAMVVGHTTISGKSVACNMAINTIGKAIVHEEPIAKCYSTNILRGTHSESGLVQSFNDTYHSLWYWDDCAGFFAEIGGWNAHILGTLCALYDGSPVELTLSRASKKSTTPNKYSCMAPFLTMLFNTTTADIEESASTKLFASGFFPRIMWFYGQGGRPRKNTLTSEEDKQVFTQVYNDVKYLRDVVGTLPNDSIIFNVCDLIEDWKIATVAGRLEREDENYRTAVARGFIHMYKIAAILAMCDPVFQDTIFSNDLSVYPVIVNIPDQHAKAAIAIVEQYLVPRMMFVQEMCNHSDAKNHQVHVGKCLTSMGGTAERTKLLRRTHLASKDLDLALGTLIESGEVKVYKDTKEGQDKPTIFIVKQI